jgi:Uma2 family endonuclease
MATRPHVRFLAEDIWDTPDDGNRYEVIDGDLFVTPPPVREHQHPSGQLFGPIWGYLQIHPIGLVYHAPIGVILDESGGVQPDLVYVSNERREILTSRGIEGAPDLVVEILSSSTRARDLGIKLRRYAAAGFPHYWIVDPQARTLAAHELDAEGYGLPSVYRSGDVFRPVLFPGLEIAISTLWA